MKKTVAIIATLDTKGEEVKYLQDQLRAKGLNVLIVDSGILNEPIAVKADVTRQTVAEAAGTTIDVLRKEYRSPAILAMMKGVPKVIAQLYAEHKFDGVMCIGGEDGAHLGASGMRVLPVGVPKLIISCIFQGTSVFKSFVGTNDVMLMHSVTDILGVNTFSKKVFDTAIAAMYGMVNEGIDPTIKGDNLIAITMFGNTTPVVMEVKSILERNGYEAVIFHPSGTGGQAMEQSIEKGIFKGVIDMTTQDVTDELFGGFHPGGPTRLEAAGKKGIAQVFVPGCMDFVAVGAVDEIPEKYKDRKFYPHNPTSTLIRATAAEMKKQAEVVASKLNKSKGPTAVAVPLRGLSMYNREGFPMFDPAADAAFLSTLKQHLDKRIKIHEVDVHINDKTFAKKCASVLLDLLGAKEQK